MELTDYIAGMSFRFITPDDRPEEGEWYLPPRFDGSRPGFLEIPGVLVDVVNTRVPYEKRYVKRLLREICTIPKMSTFAIGAIVNQAVFRMSNCAAYVNVGVWHGFSLLAGMVNNPKKMCIGVDDFSQFSGPREALLERFERCRTRHHTFFELDFVEYFTNVHERPIGVYMYDGGHSYQDQLRGLQLAEPFFAENCIILVDDTNWREPRQATLDFVRDSRHEYRILLDQTTCCNRHPTFWNGLMVLQRIEQETSIQPVAPRKERAQHPDKLRDIELVRGLERGADGGLKAIPEGVHRSSAAHPLVSLVIISHNSEHRLKRIIDMALAQTYSNAEVIVVESGSIDRSREIIADYEGEISSMWQKDRSQVTVLEAALAISHGDLVSFLEPKDTLHPGSVEQAITLYHARRRWRRRLRRSMQEILAVTSLTDALVLVDENKWGLGASIKDRNLIPFRERDGRYWGPPPDDETAIREFERLRRQGASHIVFGWPAFWWLDHYARFHQYLRSKFPCVLENDRVVAFDLGAEPKVRQDST